MGVHVQTLNHLRLQDRKSPVQDQGNPRFSADLVTNVPELVDVPTGTEPPGADLLHGDLLIQDGDAELPALDDKLMGQRLLAEADHDLRGDGGDLHRGGGDLPVHPLPLPGGDDIEAVAEIPERLVVPLDLTHLRPLRPRWG